IYPTRSYVAIARAQVAKALAHLHAGQIKGRRFRVSKL
ncbi:ATP-independent RNA helicase dbpA, partial [Xanthomonas oryzae pv. oryzae]